MRKRQEQRRYSKVKCSLHQRKRRLWQRSIRKNRERQEDLTLSTYNSNTALQHQSLYTMKLLRRISGSRSVSIRDGSQTHQSRICSSQTRDWYSAVTRNPSAQTLFGQHMWFLRYARRDTALVAYTLARVDSVSIKLIEPV